MKLIVHRRNEHHDTTEAVQSCTHHIAEQAIVPGLPEWRKLPYCRNGGLNLQQWRIVDLDPAVVHHTRICMTCFWRAHAHGLWYPWLGAGQDNEDEDDTDEEDSDLLAAYEPQALYDDQILREPGDLDVADPLAFAQFLVAEQPDVAIAYLVLFFQVCKKEIPHGN